MILAKEVLLHGRKKSRFPFGVDTLNELKTENIQHIISNSSHGRIYSCVVFYEDENVLTCPGCGHDIANTFSFCPNCGYKMYADSAEPLQCPTCNHPISSTFNFCSNCSVKLK